MSRARRRALALIAVVCCSGAVSRADARDVRQDAVWTAQLGGVEAAGSKRITPAQVAALAGLKIGAVIGPRDVEAARQRLLKSGYFRSVGFRYRNAGYSLIVTFTVEDVTWNTPVVFDNFVDQADSQIIAAVARDVPSFDGVAPDQDVILQRIAASIERLMRDARDPGTVTFALIVGGPGVANHWRFRIEREAGPLPICSVTLTGAPETSLSALNDRKAALIGLDYSKETIAKFARETFTPLVASAGGRAGTAPRVTVRRESSGGCQRGVAVTIAF